VTNTYTQSHSQGLPNQTLSSHPHLSQPTTSHPTPIKTTQRGQRVRVNHIHLRDLCDSPGSPLDLNCRKLLAYILQSHYYLYDRPEPELGTNEGTNILQYLEKEQGVTFPPSRVKRGTPLAALLTDPTQRRCLICQNEKVTPQRAVECVRSHIGHRPFLCKGYNGGCPTCRPGQG
jgi:hypothetical protein